MAAIPEILAEGQLPNSKSTLFTATISTIVRLISGKHVAGGTQTVNFYVKKSGSVSRGIGQAELMTAESVKIDDINTLEVGDEIEGESTDAASVDYVITGVTIT